jgi:hypothetical protein
LDLYDYQAHRLEQELGRQVSLKLEAIA